MHPLRSYELLQLDGRAADLPVLRLRERAARWQPVAGVARHDAVAGLSGPNGLRVPANVRANLSQPDVSAWCSDAADNYVTVVFVSGTRRKT